MWTFQYKHGDRPLEGYTIQRAAGRGGFGEVYYAVSDSGREVALKVVTGYEQIELRGISQCMNLKSPHLVTIFDVRYNDEGRPFVIMEYVAGPNLRQLLDESPAGLGTQKAAFFLREMAKGLTFLHECGIVHRDLKPANVFYENGYVKIGDYGLSKAISPTQHSGQTVTVGTVHYMAPEVGAGKYDRSIDIYALGAVLYEMLTGTPPYLGASPSEILLKHLSAEPDCGGIPEPFCTVIKKAMAKNPADRYQSVQEMVEAVFGTEHVRMSVSCFSPEELSVVAGRVAAKMRAGAPPQPGMPVGSSSVVSPNRPPPLPGGRAGKRRGGGGDALSRMGDRIDRMGDRLNAMGTNINVIIGGRRGNARDHRFGPTKNTCGDLDDSDAGIPSPLLHAEADQYDPLPRRSRRILAVISSLVLAMGAAMFVTTHDGAVRTFTPIFVFASVWGGTFGFLLALNRLLPTMTHESKWARRFALTSSVAAGAFLLGGLPFLAAIGNRSGMGTWAGLLATILLMDSTKDANPRRKERISFGHLVGTAFIAWIFSSMFGGQSLLAIATATGIAMLVQVLSPWVPAGVTLPSEAADPNAPPPPSLDNAAGYYDPAFAPGGMAPAGAPVGRDGWGQPSPNATAADFGSQTDPLAPRYRPVWRFAPGIWGAALICFLTGGLMLLIGVGTNAINGRDDQAVAIGAGVSMLLGAALSVRRIFTRRFYGIWSYLIRPLVMLVCASAIVSSGVVIGQTNVRGEDQMIGIFFIIFPAMIFLAMLFTPRQLFAPTPPAAVTAAGEISPYKRAWAFILSCFWFCGVGGLQRLYVGKVVSGLLYLFTGGLFGIGQLIDVVSIFTGRFRDAQGRPLVMWDENDRSATPSVPPVPPAAAQPQAGTPGGVQAMIQQAKDAAERAAAAAAAGNAAVARAAGDRAVAYQAHAAVDQMKWRGRAVASGAAVDLRALRQQLDLSYRPYRRGIFSALASALGGFLLLLSLIVTLGLMFQIPLALADGLPDPHVNRELTRWFGYDRWPSLMQSAGTIVALKLALIGLALTIFGRRRGGMSHILRALLGTAGLYVAAAVLAAHFDGAMVWGKVAEYMQEQPQQKGPAIEVVIQHFQTPAPYVAGGIALVSIVLLAWPERRSPVASRGAAAAIPMQMPFPPAAPIPPHAPPAAAPVRPLEPEPARPAVSVAVAAPAEHEDAHVEGVRS